MPEPMVLRFPADADGTFEYLLLDGRGGVADYGRSASDALSVLLSGRRCYVVVPGSEVLVTTVRLPTRRRARIAQALPFALEERLAGEVEDLHFAVGRVERDGTVHAAVVERAVLERWRDEWEALGLDPHAVIPENGMVPVDPAHWRVLADDRQAVLSLGDGVVALEVEAAGVALEGAVTAGLSPEVVTLEGPEAFCTRMRAVLAAAGPHEVSARTTGDPLFPCLAAEWGARPSIDLLQGDFVRRERWGWVWRPLRPAAALLALWVTVQFSLQVAEIVRLEAEYERLTAGIEQVYRDTFPGGRVVDPLAQMRQQLQAVLGGAEAGGGRLTDLLAGAGTALAADGLHLRSLQLRDGALEVEVETEDIESLERVRASIEAGGLAVEVRSASVRDGRIDGRLIIREAV